MPSIPERYSDQIHHDAERDRLAGPQIVPGARLLMFEDHLPPAGQALQGSRVEGIGAACGHVQRQVERVAHGGDGAALEVEQGVASLHAGGQKGVLGAKRFELIRVETVLAGIGVIGVPDDGGLACAIRRSAELKRDARRRRVGRRALERRRGPCTFVGGREGHPGLQGSTLGRRVRGLDRRRPGFYEEGLEGGDELI